jgi:hypothetical protein
MNGKEISDGAVALARSKGYIAAHFSPARVRDSFITNYAYDSKGFPDLILVGPKMLAVEVKGDGDRISEAQEGWLAAFERAGVETLVLTSKGWRNGELDALL